MGAGHLASLTVEMVSDELPAVNKADVIHDVAASAGVNRYDVERVLDAFFDTVTTAVCNGERVAWPSFGSFSPSARPARSGRNPRTGEPLQIAASLTMRFSPSTTLKALLNPPPVWKLR